MKKLSGGMKRRAGIALAMLNDPQLLILDEPTAGLDPNERIRFRNLISELAEDRLVLLSTHIVSDVEYIANQILLMKDGSLVHQGHRPGPSRHRPHPGVDLHRGLGTGRGASPPVSRLQPQVPAPGDPASHPLPDPAHPEAMPETMTLEDLFLYYFGERAGETDDTL